MKQNEIKSNSSGGATVIVNDYVGGINVSECGDERHEARDRAPQ